MPFSEGLRRRIRKRTDYTCCRCHEIGVEVHHIVPQAEGGDDTEENAAPLCPNCHTWFGGNPEKRKEIREMRDSWHERVETMYGGRENEMARRFDEVLSEVRTLGAKAQLTEKTPLNEGLDDSRLRRVREALKPNERCVFENPISADRAATLKAGIESDRKSSGVRKLFRAAGAYERCYEYRSDRLFGNRVPIWKGPFVERSTWVEWQSRDFSAGLEGFLLSQLGELLRGNLDPIDPLGSWDDVVDFIEDSVGRMERDGGHADMLVFRGELEQSLRLDFFRNADWSRTPEIRGVDLSEAQLFHEIISKLPVLQIRDGHLPPSIHVIDLSDFRYVQYNPDAMSDEDVRVRVEEIHWERAVEMINGRPDFAASLYRSTHGTEGRFSREEAVVRMLLQVILHVIESGFIEPTRTMLSQSSALPGKTS